MCFAYCLLYTDSGILWISQGKEGTTTSEEEALIIVKTLNPEQKERLLLFLREILGDDAKPEPAE